MTSDFDPNDENNASSAAVTTPGLDQADLIVTKNGPSKRGPDTDVAFVITVGNAGPNNAQNFVLQDILPGTMTFVSIIQTSGPTFPPCTTPSVGANGTVTCSIPTLSAGQSASFTLTGHIPSGTPVERFTPITRL